MRTVIFTLRDLGNQFEGVKPGTCRWAVAISAWAIFFFACWHYALADTSSQCTNAEFTHDWRAVTTLCRTDAQAWLNQTDSAPPNVQAMGLIMAAKDFDLVGIAYRILCVRERRPARRPPKIPWLSHALPSSRNAGQ